MGKAMKLPKTKERQQVPDVCQRSQAPGFASHVAMLALTPVLCFSAVAVHAQEGDGRRAGGSGLSVLPSLGLSQTLTDNNTLTSAAKDAALVSVLTPGVSIRSSSGRLRGSLDYSLSAILYTKSEQKNRTQQSMAAQGVAELVENALYVDARANIAQQASSAFGQQTADSRLGDPNRTEVASLNLAPYLRGRLGGLASFELRGTAMETNAKGGTTGDSRNTGGSLRVDGLGNGKLRWWSSLSTQKTHFKAGNTKNESSTANVGLRYRPDVDLEFGFNGGPERNDYFGSRRSGSNYGVSANWSPSVRTKLASDWQYHDYGNSHSFSFEHRMSRSSWRILDAQSVSLGDQSGATGTRNNYELLFLQFASIEPDLIKRDLLVRNYLQAQGLSPDAITSSGFLTSAPSTLRRQEISFSLLGQRTTLLTSLSQSTTSRLGTNITVGDDLAQSAKIVQRGLSVSLSHRLTPSASASLSFSEQQTRGDSAGLSTTLRSVLASWTGRLGLRTSVSLGARHTQFESSAPYRENAIFANLTQQF